VAPQAAPARANRETEVKIRIQNSRIVRRKLKDLGFAEVHRRSLEDNVLYDTPDRALRRTRSILRLRRYGGRWWVTWKGTPDPDPNYKSRVELEAEIHHAGAIEAILRMLGFVPVFRYQKYRTQFARDSERGRKRPLLEVSLDETPIGDFIEIEGNRRGIDRIARALGHARDEYSTASYGALYLEHCNRKGIAPGDMVFERPAMNTGRRADTPRITKR
jgi:adenylate cyclase class 2